MEAQAGAAAQAGSRAEAGAGPAPAPAPAPGPGPRLPEPEPEPEPDPRPTAEQVFVSPLNFAMVSAGIYRSGYPGERNFPFLARLKLKTILHVGLKKYLPANVRFAEEQGIRVLQCPLSGNKEPFVSITEESLAAALLPMLEPANLPLLIHCNKGKSRTGVVVGCYRRLQNWSLTAIFEEYRRYQGRRGEKLIDLQFIELFAPAMLQRQRPP